MNCLPHEFVCSAGVNFCKTCLNPLYPRCRLPRVGRTPRNHVVVVGLTAVVTRGAAPDLVMPNAELVLQARNTWGGVGPSSVRHTTGGRRTPRYRRRPGGNAQSRKSRGTFFSGAPAYRNATFFRNARNRFIANATGFRRFSCSRNRVPRTPRPPLLALYIADHITRRTTTCLVTDGYTRKHGAQNVPTKLLSSIRELLEKVALKRYENVT